MPEKCEIAEFRREMALFATTSYGEVGGLRTRGHSARDEK